VAHPRSSEKTKELSLVLSWNSSQESSWSRGNWVLKEFKKEGLEEAKVAAEALPAGSKECEATSAMSFRQPWIETATSGEASLTLLLIMRARTRQWPMRERLDVIRRAQLTVEVLSHHAATCSFLRRTSISRTRCWRRSPAISRSLMVMSPVGLDRETRRAVMSAGQARRYTTG
jgi:hypothetical protein